MTLIEKTDTSVTPVSSRTTANAPSTAIAPTSVGINAATTLPKMSRLSRKTIGMLRLSARAMSSDTCSLTSPKTAHSPPMLVVRPGASSSSATASQLSDLASWVSPSRVRITRVVRPSAPTRLGSGVS